MAIYRLGQKIKELFIRGRSIAKVYDHGQLVFNKGQSVVNYTFSINPNPSDATVVIERSDTGEQFNTKTITVPSGTQIVWTVSKTGYATQTDSLIVASNITQNVTLVRDTSSAQWWCYSATITSMSPDQHTTHLVTLYFYAEPSTGAGGYVYCKPYGNPPANVAIDYWLYLFGSDLANNPSQLRLVQGANSPAIIASKTDNTLTVNGTFAGTVFNRYSAGDLY